MNYAKEFLVEPGKKINLADRDPDFCDGLKKKDTLETLAKNVQRLAELQYLMYAENRRSLLIVLQGLDAGGKDGTIRHVLAPMNPQGCKVAPFKVPNAVEAEHDFLWRIHRNTPANGEVVIFNRSHYEDVLVVRVHDLVPKKIWSKRYEMINEFEDMLQKHDTHILKFFLHISKDEQLDRFKRRLDRPEKQWKISDADYKEREYWDDYTKAYEDALSKCSKDHAPWFVIPANNKWFRNLAISEIILDTMENMGMKMPQPTVDIEQIRKQYHAAVKEADGDKDEKK